MSHENNQLIAPHSSEDGFELSQIIQFQDDLIWISPVCDFFNISRKWQQEVIRKDPFLASAVRKNSNYLLFGDRKTRVSLPKKAFIRWVQLINPEIVKEELRPKLMLFQNLVFDHLYGSAEERDQQSVLYKEMVNLENDRASINARLKTIRAALRRYWSKSYGQMQMNLPEKTN
jgi:hypothetical protein